MHRLAVVVIECLILLSRLLLVLVPGRGAAYVLGYESDTPGCSELDVSYFPYAEVLLSVYPRHGLERASSASNNIVGEACRLLFCMFVGFYSTGSLFTGFT